MPRTRYTPNQADIQTIKAFLRTVSWGGTCQLIQSLDGAYCYLHCKHYLLVPCPWNEYEKRSVEAIATAKRYNTKPGLIISGECSEHDFGRVNWWACREGFVVYWLGCENLLRHGDFILRSLDGIEWWNPELWGKELAKIQQKRIGNV